MNGLLTLFFRDFMIVMDSAAVTARVANASVFREIHPASNAQVVALRVESFRSSLKVALNKWLRISFLIVRILTGSVVILNDQWIVRNYS